MAGEAVKEWTLDPNCLGSVVAATLLKVLDFSVPWILHLYNECDNGTTS